MNPVAARLFNQQIVAPRFSKPCDVVGHFGAMQAQEYRLMRWAVAMRTKKPSLKSFENDYNTGRIVRLHLLRGTWQLVSGEDYWWMLDLCSAKSASIIRGWMKSNKISIPDDEVRKVHTIFENKVVQCCSVTKEDFVDALAEKNIYMDDHRLSYHIRMAELSGLLCSGDLHPMKATYSLASQKIPVKSNLSRDESLLLLARKYFQSHSPASLEDFAWWSALGMNDCKRGIELLGNEIHIEKWKDNNFYVLDGCRVRGVKKGSVVLLPSYDEYLIGYKSRNVVLPDEYRHRAHNNSGIFYPVVLNEGIVCGNWKPFEKKYTADYFEQDLKEEPIAWSTYNMFLTR